MNTMDRIRTYFTTLLSLFLTTALCAQEVFISQFVDADVEPGGTLVVDGTAYHLGRNLVYNGQFTIQNGDYLPGWMQNNYHTLASTGNLNITSEGHDGSKSAAAKSSLAYIVARWNVQPGHRYVFSFWARNLNATRQKNTVLSLTGAWSVNRSENNTNRVLGDGALLVNISSETTEWLRTTVVFDAGENSYAQFYMQGPSALSDVRLCELTTTQPTPAQTAPGVFNGDFVLSTSGWNDAEAKILPQIHNNRVDTVFNVQGSQAYNIQQTLCNLPKGLYLLKSNAFCRPDNMLSVADHRYDPSLRMAQLFIADEAMAVRGIADDIPLNEDQPFDYRQGCRIGKALAFPDTITQVNLMFQASRYENRVVGFVADGTTTIGLKNTAARAEGAWDAADNFSIAYLYNDLAAPATDGLSAYVQELAARPMQATAREQLLSAREQLETSASDDNYRQLASALNAAQQSANEYAVLQSAMQRLSLRLPVAEGVSESLRQEVLAAVSHYGQVLDEGSLGYDAIQPLLYEADALLESLYLIAVNVHAGQNSSIFTYDNVFGKLTINGYDPADVNLLTITGYLSDNDFYRLRSEATSLVSLDISGVNMPVIGSDFHFPSLERVILPQNLQYICDNYGFEDCTALREVVFGDSLFYLGNYAFAGCESLESVALPASLREIGFYAFDGCSSLASVTLCEGLITIAPDAFRNCNSLTSITLPASLEGASSYRSIANCQQLRTVYLRTVYPPSTEMDYLLGVYVTDVYVPEKGYRRFTTMMVGNSSMNIKAKGFRHYRIHSYEVPDLNSDIKVITNKMLTVTDGGTADKPNLTIWMSPAQHITLWGGGTAGASDICVSESYGHLTVNGEGMLSLASFAIRYDHSHLAGYHVDKSWSTVKYLIGGYMDEKYCTLVSQLKMRADTARVHVNLSAGRWLFFCPPFNVRLSEIQSLNGRRFVCRTYSGANRASRQGNTWVDLAADDVLQAGQGYIFMTDDSDVRTASSDDERKALNLESCLVLTAINDIHKNDIFTAQNVETPLVNHESKYVHNLNWNFVGNPYPAFFDLSYTNLTSPIIVYKITETNTIYDSKWSATYRAVSPIDDDYILAPGEAFFMQKPLYLKTLAFDKAGRQHTAVKRASSAPRREMKRMQAGNQRELYDLTLSLMAAPPQPSPKGEGESCVLTDRARIVLNPQASLSYELECDAAKMSSDGAPQIFTTYDQVAYDINERPIGDGTAVLTIVIPTDGDYQLSLQTRYTDSSLLLTDRLTGRQQLLAPGEAYRFSATAGNYPARFTVGFHPETSGIVQMENGKLKMENSPVFDLSGRKLSPEKSPSSLKKGIYIIGNKKTVIK